MKLWYRFEIFHVNITGCGKWQAAKSYHQRWRESNRSQSCRSSGICQPYQHQETYLGSRSEWYFQRTFPPGPPIYRYPAINTRHISRVYFTNKKSCSFVGVETNLPPIHINGNEFAFPDHHQYQKVRNPPDRLALPVLINNLGKKQKLLILKYSR